MGRGYRHHKGAGMDEIDCVARGYEKALDRAKEEVAKLQAGAGYDEGEEHALVRWLAIVDSQRNAVTQQGEA